MLTRSAWTQDLKKLTLRCAYIYCYMHTAFVAACQSAVSSLAEPVARTGYWLDHHRLRCDTCQKPLCRPQNAVSIAPQALKEAGVEVIVAPYEADAQMAFLARSSSVHAVHAVITEDSDLLTYGCPRVRPSATH